MKNQENYQVEGAVTESLPNTMFRVQLDPEAPADLAGKIILCTLSGKMRLYKIKVMPGDRVKCEISPYDLARGRIVFRNK